MYAICWQCYVNQDINWSYWVYKPMWSWLKFPGLPGIITTVYRVATDVTCYVPIAGPATWPFNIWILCCEKCWLCSLTFMVTEGRWYWGKNFQCGHFLLADRLGWQFCKIVKRPSTFNVENVLMECGLIWELCVVKWQRV